MLIAQRSGAVDASQPAVANPYKRASTRPKRLRAWRTDRTVPVLGDLSAHPKLPPHSATDHPIEQLRGLVTSPTLHQVMRGKSFRPFR